MAMLPVAAPFVFGSNVTLRAAVWLGVRINPEFTPEPLKPAPFKLTAEIVMLDVPVFVSETSCEVFVPTATSPNVRVEGETLSEWVAVPPLPDKAIDSGESGALLTSEIEPETVDVELGLKATPKEADCPAWIISGAVSPVVLKPFPVTANSEIVRLALPVLEITIGCELMFPVVTVPKFTLERLAVICGPVPVPPGTPAHPAITTIDAKVKTRLKNFHDLDKKSLRLQVSRAERLKFARRAFRISIAP
jgi:hypothetical protein